MKALVTIPTYVRRSLDVQTFETTLRTLRETEADCDVLVVDDGSPADDLVVAVDRACAEYGAELVPKQENEGFSSAVNVGLRRCLEEGRDAVLCNSDIEFGLTVDWLGIMERQVTEDGNTPASIVGALLLYPNGLIAHAGIYCSMLTRDFNHRYRFGPGNLPEAQIATLCPVTAALMFIRHECLEGVGIYDEEFRLGWEDVDYNVRAWQSGRSIVYQPGVRAVHDESFFRGRPTPKMERWTAESWSYFRAKHAAVDFSNFVPDMMG